MAPQMNAAEDSDLFHLDATEGKRLAKVICTEIIDVTHAYLLCINERFSMRDLANPFCVLFCSG
jgi:hypothetical protein